MCKGKKKKEKKKEKEKKQEARTKQAKTTTTQALRDKKNSRIRCDDLGESTDRLNPRPEMKP
jgi:hypothetical protein